MLQKLLLTLAFCFAREDPASIEYAEYKCEDFYNQRRENDFGIEIRFLAEGAQGKVYKCETNDQDSDLPVVAMKLWKNPEWVNFPEKEIKESTLYENGIAVPLYEYFYGRLFSQHPGGKIEHFISELEDAGYERMTDPIVYQSIAKELAKMHLIDELDIRVKYQDCEWWNWNTDCIYNHLTTENGIGNGGNVAKVAEALDIPLGEMDEEYKWIEQTVRNGKQLVTFCHNDLHGKNAMVKVNQDGSVEPNSAQLIDFDISEWGYRAWDFNYYFSRIRGEAFPTDDLIDDFISAYLDVWNSGNKEKYSVEQLRDEIEHHRPYALMEQMLHLSWNPEPVRSSHIQGYKEVCKKLGHRYETKNLQ